MTNQAIKRWMRSHVSEHVDDCNEVDTTGLAEAWDRECADGGATLDPDHPAWFIAYQVGKEYEKAND